MSEIQFHDDTKEILIGTAFTFLESPYDVNIFDVQEKEDFVNAKKLINSIIIDFECNSKEDFERYLTNYKEIAHYLVKTEEKEELVGAIQWNKKQNRISVPFKLYYLLCEYTKIRRAFDGGKINTTIYLIGASETFGKEYNEYIKAVSYMRASTIFRGNFEDHYFFEDEKDWEIVKGICVNLMEDENDDSKTTLRGILFALKNENIEVVNALLKHCGGEEIKSTFTYQDELYEEQHHFLDYLIIFNLFFGRYYSFCFSEDYGTKLLGLGQGVRICDSEYVGEYITGRNYGGVIATQNIDYTEVLAYEKGTSGEEIAKYIEQFRENELSKKHSSADSLKKANIFIAQCLEKFDKVEFELLTKHSAIDSVKIHVTERDPLKFKETKEKMPIIRPESKEKRNGKKPFRVYTAKKKL